MIDSCPTLPHLVLSLYQQSHFQWPHTTAQNQILRSESKLPVPVSGTTISHWIIAPECAPSISGFRTRSRPRIRWLWRDFGTDTSSSQPLEWRRRDLAISPFLYFYIFLHRHFWSNLHAVSVVAFSWFCVECTLFFDSFRWHKRRKETVLRGVWLLVAPCLWVFVAVCCFIIICVLSFSYWWIYVLFITVRTGHSANLANPTVFVGARGLTSVWL